MTDMNLAFMDLVIARVIYEAVEAGHKPPTQRQLLTPHSNENEGSTGLANEYLISRQIPASFTSLLTSNQRLTTAIKRLRHAKLIQPKGAYAPTEELKKFWERCGHGWELWPILTPVSSAGEILFDQAEYRRKVRGYREKRKRNE
jgi:hypothetical protein